MSREQRLTNYYIITIIITNTYLKPASTTDIYLELSVSSGVQLIMVSLQDAHGQYTLPYDSEVECKKYIIVYDGTTDNLTDPGQDSPLISTVPLEKTGQV